MYFPSSYSTATEFLLSQASDPWRLREMATCLTVKCKAQLVTLPSISAGSHNLQTTVFPYVPVPSLLGIFNEKTQVLITPRLLAMPSERTETLNACSESFSEIFLIYHS